MKYLFILVLIYILASCNNSYKKAVDNPSINKIWEYRGYDSVKSKLYGFSYEISNIMDFTNKDTLKLIYPNIKDGTTLYPYKILHNSIFIDGEESYKIVTLTSDQLDLSFPMFYTKNGQTDTLLVVTVYTPK